MTNAGLLLPALPSNHLLDETTLVLTTNWTTKASSVGMAETKQNSSKRAQARVRFSDDTHRIVLSDYHGRLRDLPLPSPAPAHLRRHKPVYRPVIYALEVLILCLLAVILLLMAVWVYHLARYTSSSSPSLWKGEMLKKLSMTSTRVLVSL